MDRSYTVSLIFELSKHPEGLSREEVERFFAEDFVKLTSRTVIERDARYELAPLGRFLAWSFQWTRMLFSVPDRQA